MILPDFILPSRVNQHWQYSGLDSINGCLDKAWFKQYPHTVEYYYNSRGFRDTEWPDSVNELKNSIWCVGDSFTVGLGSPIEHTWPYLLNKKLKKQTINISMDGASNDWISRKVVRILKEIQPKNMVIHWSYIERRESDNCLLNDEDRRLPYLVKDLDNGFDNLQLCVKSVEQHSGACQIVHSFIPKSYSTPTAQYCQALLDHMFKNKYNLGLIKQLDYARDYHHYDIKTSDYFTNQLLAVLKL